MSDDIYKGSFAGVTPAWHKIGHPLVKGTKAHEAMVIAGQADWDLRSIPLEVMGVNTKGMYVLVRKDGEEMVIASDQLVEHAYTPISNEEIFGPMVEMLAGEQMPVDCAGVLGRLGNRAFMTFSGGHTEVGGAEKYDEYTVAIANHSGRAASLLMSTAIRVVCANTERAAKAQAEAAGKMISIKHNRVSIDAFYNNADAARNILGLAHNYRRNLEEMAADMQEVPFDGPMISETARQFRASLGEGETHLQKLARDNAVEALRESFITEMERCAKLDQPFYSLWTAKQAVSTYTQHESRGGEIMRAKRSMKLAEGIEPKMMSDLHGIVSGVAKSMAVVSDEKLGRALQWIGG